MYYQPYPYYMQNCQPYPFCMQNVPQVQIPPYMQNAGWRVEEPIQAQLEEDMPEYQLEMMYPRTYYIIYPVVVRHCDMFDQRNGGMRLPTKEEVDRMVDDITMEAETEVEAAINSEMREEEMRQLGFVGRGLLGDLAGILLLRELFQRRHRPHRPRRRPYPYRME